MDNGTVQANSGMVRKIDDLGRIVVPAETRKLFHINEGDRLAISVDNETETIMLQKLDRTCTFCGSLKEVTQFKEKGLCAECALVIIAERS